MAASVCPKGWNCPANLCAPYANYNAGDATPLAALTRALVHYANSPVGFANSLASLANCLAGLANSLAQAANPMETPVFQGFFVSGKKSEKKLRNFRIPRASFL